MRIVCTGISHKTADLALREKFAFGPTRLERALRSLFDRWPATDFMLLSTCNRTELYLIRAIHGHPRNEEIVDWFSDILEMPTEDFEDSIYIQEDAQAVAQMFAVASGLDSMVPGESQIVSQLKQALASAQRLQTARATMTTLVAEALHTAKHVRSETGIAEGKVSVASVALDLISKRFTSLTGKTVLSIGAGKMNEILLQTLRTLQPEKITVLNRSMDKAIELAESCGGEYASFDKLPQLLAQNDIAITSTASQEPIITSEIVTPDSTKNRLFVDLAVPRDIDSDVELIDGVELYNIDDLNETINQALTARLQHVEAAEKIVCDHVRKFMKSTSMREVTPTIEALYRKVDEMIEEELKEAASKLSTHDDAEEDLEIIRRSLWRAFRKFCHPAAENLRKSPTARSASAHAKMLRTLFGLTDD